MGRRKLIIRRLESKKDRLTKFSKRKKGILKKANELSILCDVDLALLVFSPTGKSSLFTSQNRNLSDILERLSKITADEKEQRRAYTKKMLKKMFENSSHMEANSNNFVGERNEALKAKEEELQELKEKIAEKSKILRDWQNPCNVQDLAQIRIMEQHLVASIGRIRNVKARILQELIYNGGRQERVNFV